MRKKTSKNTWFIFLPVFFLLFLSLFTEKGFTATKKSSKKLKNQLKVHTLKSLKKTKAQKSQILSKKKGKTFSKALTTSSSPEEAHYILYEVKKGDTPREIAKKYGIDVKELLLVNPIDPRALKPGMMIKVPVKSEIKEDEHRKEIALKKEPIEKSKEELSGEGEVLHEVKKGETAFRIAKKYGIKVEELLAYNHLDPKALKPGMKLRIPKPQTSLVEAKPLKEKGEEKKEEVYYTVKKGDTLFSIARRYGMSVEELKILNHLKGNSLKIGQKLLVKVESTQGFIERGISERKEVGNLSEETSTQGYKFHTVKEGETLYRLSLMYGVPLEELRRVNNLQSDILFVGQKLKIPQVAKLEETPFVLEKPKGLEKEREESLSEKFEKSLLKKRDYLTPAMLTKEEEKALMQKFIEISSNYADNRYRLGGSGGGYLDCSAFVKLVYEELGIKLPRSSVEQFQVGIPVEREELLPGDLVFFKTRGNRISHVGIYLGDNRFIHISSSRKRISIDSLDDPYYKKRYAGAKRVLNGEVLEYFQDYLRSNREKGKNQERTLQDTLF